MKTLKRISTVLLAGILAAALFVIPSYAVGYGEVQFTDPEAKSGQEFEVTAKMTCGGQLIGDGKIVLKYDPQYLEFVEGTGSRDAGEGTVTIFNAGTGTETELAYTIKFKALKEGETEITVSDSEAYLWNNQTLELTLGTSKVAIGAGDGTETETKKEDDSSADGEEDDGATVKGDGPTVTVGGKKYRIINKIPPVVIPQGFDKTKINFSGKDVAAIQQAKSGQVALYMTDGKDKVLFLYNEDDGSFLPFELIDISPDSYIILLQDDGTVRVPRGFDQVTFKYNGQEFPAWQNPGFKEYYLVYALNKAGARQLYLYDKKDDTFQRFNPDILKKKAAPAKSRGGVAGRILDFIEDHLKPVLIAMAALMLFLLLLALILGIKVRNRNVEIDDLYYELDGRPGPPPIPGKTSKKARKAKKAKHASKKPKKSRKSRPQSAGRGRSPYDYDDDYPLEDKLFDDSAFDAYEYDDYENDFSFDDDDEILENPTGHLPRKLTDTLADHRPIDADLEPRRQVRKKAPAQTNQKFHVDSDDTFKLDFIDLDD